MTPSATATACVCACVSGSDCDCVSGSDCDLVSGSGSGSEVLLKCILSPSRALLLPSSNTPTPTDIVTGSYFSLNLRRLSGSKSSDDDDNTYKKDIKRNKKISVKVRVRDKVRVKIRVRIRKSV